jgi:nicotinate-nucleotide pyrophosphorylase (carboxylating)
MTVPRYGTDEAKNAETLIALALNEDWDSIGDITSNATIPASASGEAHVVARQTGVICGLPILEQLCGTPDVRIDCELRSHDGDTVDAGDQVARLFGNQRRILAIERVALNFLQRLSGIATLTGQYVWEVSETRAVILDTRKTTPGWRFLEKYAVRCGGGQNHRFGLYDAVLIKDNHLAALVDAGAANPIAAAISAARARARRGTIVEVEVDTLEQFSEAIRQQTDIILLDNFQVAALGEAVRLRNALAPRVLLEASGGVNFQTAREIARSGVDRISVGALTHSAPALDLALDYVS